MAEDLSRTMKTPFLPVANRSSYMHPIELTFVYSSLVDERRCRRRCFLEVII